LQTLAVIPARGGSKGIPRKNILTIAGKPLIAWTIEAALKAKNITRVIVSTDDYEIAKIAKKFKAEVPFLRPEELALDNTPTKDVLCHLMKSLKKTESWVPDAVVTLQPTSPLRDFSHIEEAISLFEADSIADSLVSCIEVPHIFRPESVMRLDARGYLIPYYNMNQPLRRQDKEVVWARNGAAIYITRQNKLDDFIFGGNLIAYPMHANVSVDIDTMEDFYEAENYLKKKIGINKS
jgi:CMP-N,N'-diacetyllegionaminic acid synthase